MRRTSSNFSKCCGRVCLKDKRFVVLSLADQRLTLEHSERLEDLREGMSINMKVQEEILTYRIVPIISCDKISRWPWRSTLRLKVPDETYPSLLYPVNIHLNDVASYMWLRRLFGTVRGARVYTGPLPKF